MLHSIFTTSTPVILTVELDFTSSPAFTNTFSNPSKWPIEPLFLKSIGNEAITALLALRTREPKDMIIFLLFFFPFFFFFFLFFLLFLTAHLVLHNKEVKESLLPSFENGLTAPIPIFLFNFIAFVVK